LWLVRAELAFDQWGGMRASMLNWSLALSASAGLTLLFGAFLATADLDVPSRAAVAPVLAWLTLATVVSGECASRNPRRHVRLRRMQRELETAYAAAPGPIPAGPTVRLGNLTPCYRPDNTLAEHESQGVQETDSNKSSARSHTSGQSCQQFDATPTTATADPARSGIQTTT
jgi:hypothetical protein